MSRNTFNQANELFGREDEMFEHDQGYIRYPDEALAAMKWVGRSGGRFL